MKEATILFSLTDEESAFIAREIAAENYVDEAAVVHAGLSALIRNTSLRGPVGEANDDGLQRDLGFSESDADAFVRTDDESLRHCLSRSEGSGVSDRDIPAIVESVKAKLRANGAL
jgi:Arc/MetJ-type ribon-helix-helix transcriptional regulator